MSTPQPEPSRQPALPHRRRLALLLGIPIAILVIAVGAWAVVPKSSPATGGSVASTSTSASNAPKDLLSAWEQTLRNVDIAGDCDGEKAFTPNCMNEADHLGSIARNIATQADQLGSRYGQVKAEADEVFSNASKWATCPQTAAYSSERRDCLNALGRMRVASESILAQIYAVERP